MARNSVPYNASGSNPTKCSILFYFTIVYAYFFATGM